MEKTNIIPKSLIELSQVNAIRKLPTTVTLGAKEQTRLLRTIQKPNEITRNHVLKLGNFILLLGDGLFSSEEWQHANRQMIRARAIDFIGV
ncbi:hypothetical protein CEXT_768241 [Caerostris extrusa]|uniref:Uncharacterized protein n=1 Tax=Caerostris extrusa TaxID=172846 RepID=A0AAV4QUQ6_CAEEX|nr:hypothetical protein CEXT_768241 [Caerostris extrusa]